MKVKLLSRVQLLATPWTAAYQAPPSMGFSRQEYWSRVPLPSPELLSNTQIILRIELSEETYVLTKQEILLGKGTQMESIRVREPRRTALPRGSQSWVLW